MTIYIIGQVGECRKCHWAITASSDRHADFIQRVELHEEREGHVIDEGDLTSKDPVEKSWIKVHKSLKESLVTECIESS